MVEHCYRGLRMDHPDADDKIVRACATLMAAYLATHIDDPRVDADGAKRMGEALAAFLELTQVP